MTASAWNSIANTATSLTKTILQYYNLSSDSSDSDAISQSAQRHPPPLVLPKLPEILPRLLKLGLSDRLASGYHLMLVNALRKMDASLQESYQTQVSLTRENEQNPQASRLRYIQTFESQLLVSRAECVERLWQTVVSIAQEHQHRLNHSSSLPFPSPSSTSQSLSPTASASSSSKGRKVRPHNFSKEQTAVLQALLARDDQYSTEDKDYIAEALNLTREQVNRWFCNARARRYKPYSRPRRRDGSSSLERTLQENGRTDSFQSRPSDQSSEEISRATSPTRSTSSDDSSLASQQPSNDSQPPLPDPDPMDLYIDFDALPQADQTEGDQLSTDVGNMFNFNPLDPSCPPVDPSLYMLDSSFNPPDPSTDPLYSSSNPPFPSQVPHETSMWMF